MGLHATHRPGKDGKQFGVPLEPAAFTAHVQGLLADIHACMLAEATAFRNANIVDVKTYEELKAAVAEVGCVSARYTIDGGMVGWWDVGCARNQNNAMQCVAAAGCVIPGRLLLQWEL